jgi:hypothetical protein
MNTDYIQFLESKQHSIGKEGIEPNWIPDDMFDFQKYVTEHVIRKGRCAGFLDTGLGKTIIQLTVAVNFYNHTKKPVLIITPLAVAFQFIKEAKKFHITDIQYSKDGKYESSIVVCNYERLHLFNSNDFDCVILDESSILKNFDGTIKNQITYFIKKVKYRFLFTATPSPNDFIELGTSSEALGYLGYTDMLTKFFTNNDIMLYNAIAKKLADVRVENKTTIQERCEMAVQLANHHETSVYWCNLNPEGDLLEKMDKDSYQIKGSMSLDKKEDILLNFSEGKIKKLITKPKMTAFGLNWQHCNHTIYFPTFSYEQYYQAIRRFWRFGQQRPVNVDLVYSDGQKRVLDSIVAKTQKANDLFSKLNSSLHQDFKINISKFDKPVTLPQWLKIN